MPLGTLITFVIVAGLVIAAVVQNGKISEAEKKLVDLEDRFRYLVIRLNAKHFL